MKKITSLVLVIVLAISAFALTGCFGPDINAKSEGVMTWEEYNAAAIDSKVVIEGYIQGVQAWNSQYGNITLYMQDGVGAYFVYRLVCTEEEAAKLVPGVKVKIEGTKAEWAGEVEIVDVTLFEVCTDGGKYIAKAKDVTELLGTDELVRYMNMLVSFKDMTVVSINPQGEGSDIEVKLSKNGAEYTFYVESSLTGPDTAVYAKVGQLKAGDVVDIEGFLYWYNGVNTHITSVK